MADQFPLGLLGCSFLSHQRRDQWLDLLTQIKWMKRVMREAISLLCGAVFGNAWITLKAQTHILNMYAEGPMRPYQNMNTEYGHAA